MAPCHSSEPCFVSPHPNIIAKLRAEKEALKARGGDDRANTRALNDLKTILHNSRSTPGMDDGLIFPKEHYEKPTSLMAMSRAALERSPLRGKIRVIVCLVEFKDIKLSSGAKDHIRKVFFSSGELADGSMNEYYQTVSNKKVSFDGEVIGPFTLSEKMEYYANGQYGRTLQEPNARTMAGEAFEAARNSVDWSTYDNDKNGYVDAFVVVHAGQAADEYQDVNNIWSLKWVLPQQQTQNNVNIYGFLTVSEFAKIGVCAHEIGHLVFGWPDLYDIDNTSAGVGNWCLMSAGSWGGGGDRPVHPSAWAKASQGWIDTVVEKENHQITLQDVKKGFKAHRLWTDGDESSKEYFLIENRQLSVDRYDGSLPGGGLIVWHVDDNVSTNMDENHPLLKIMEADGQEQLEVNWNRGDAGDPFPGMNNNSTFDSVSKPSSKSYSGTDTFVSITKIPAPAETMTFDITVKRKDSDPPQFNPKKWYRLKNTYEPRTFSLDVINDNGTDSTGFLQMARDGNFSGQYWQIVSNNDGTYYLRTLFLGPNRRLDIDVSDTPKGKPILKPMQDVHGQFWKIKGWEDGTWHIENTLLGEHLYLDTMEGGPKVQMNDANIGRPTQRWTIAEIRDIYESGWF